MKKLLLSLGALSAIVAPVAAVVACGSTTDSKDNEANEVWNQKAGTRVFHVGTKLDGAAKHHTAGQVVEIDPEDTGSYGFHSLFGFLKHSTQTKLDSNMFAIGDEVVVTVGAKEYTATFDTALINQFKALEAQIKTMDAKMFSALDAKKHPGTPIISAKVTTGDISIQTQALEYIISAAKITGDDKKTVEGWAAPHNYALYNSANEVWNQTAGTRVFHVGMKIDGAAKHGTAGTVVAIDPTDTGSYGFHSLFGFLKHSTKAKPDSGMFVVGDQVVISVVGNEYTVKFDAPLVKKFADIKAKIAGMDAKMFSALDAAKHPGTPIELAKEATAIAPSTTVNTLQIDALDTLIAAANMSVVDKAIVRGWAAPHNTESSEDKNEIWKQAPGSRMFFVGEYINGAAKHHTAGQVVALDPSDTGSYGFHTLFGFLKHVTKESTLPADKDMFVAGDSITITVSGKTHTHVITAADVETFKNLVKATQSLDASQFSDPNAKDKDGKSIKHAGAPLGHAELVSGTATVQTVAMNDILYMFQGDEKAKMSNADVAIVKGWAGYHLLGGAAPTQAAGKVYQLDEAMSAGPWHKVFRGNTLQAGDVLQIGEHKYTVKTSDLATFNSISQSNMIAEGNRIKALIMAA